MKTIGERKKDFIEQTNIENAKRLQNIALVIMFIVAIQAVSYTLAHNTMYGFSLIIVKISILIAGIVVVTGLWRLRKFDGFLRKHSTIYLFSSAFAMIAMATVNTFVAQDISSDISIYILVLMAVISSCRMDTKWTIGLLSSSYIIFAIGIGFFQLDPVYLLSHRVNGAISNILAFVISRMFFQYQIKDYKDKIAADIRNKELQILSEIDDLTGLYNKGVIYSKLSEMIENARNTNGNVYLGLLDLDHFKEINDRYGHLYGDEVLKEIALKIQENVREEDFVGRYGGDEFVIVFQNTDSEMVVAIMKRLLEEVNRLVFRDCKISFSCGVAIWNGESCENLLKRADEYMYEVKQIGKNNIKIEKNRF